MFKMIRVADPGAACNELRLDIETAVRRVLDSGSYILGGEVAEFEKEFARFLGGGEAVGVASGTDAIELALRALEIGSGDAVVAPSFTAVGTIAAIERCGATPIFADIEPRTFTLSPSSVARCLQHYTKIRAILPVHLFGQPADMAELQKLAADRGVQVIEDCAQAHGATWREQAAGTLGTIAAFSFYPTKNLGGIGDGGGVVTRSPELAEKVRCLRQYGWSKRYISEVRGINSRLDELQAAILRVKLSYLQSHNQQRKSIAERYDNALAKLVSIPFVSPDCSQHVYHQYAIRTPVRDQFKSFLTGKEIPTSVLYPLPVHCQPAYARDCKTDPTGLPESEKAAQEILCLPMHPHLTDSDVERVCAAVEAFEAIDRK